MSTVALIGVLVIFLWAILFGLYLYSSKQHVHLHQEITNLQQLLDKVEHKNLKK